MLHLTPLLSVNFFVPQSAFLPRRFWTSLPAYSPNMSPGLRSTLAPRWS
jgi:hypothetical protein